MDDAVNLKFSEPLNTAHPVDLRFGAPLVSTDESNIRVVAVLAPPQFRGRIAQINPIRSLVVLPTPTGRARLHYDKSVYRGPSAATGSAWQPANSQRAYAQQQHQPATPLRAYVAQAQMDAAPVHAGPQMPWQSGTRLKSQPHTAWQDGARVGAQRAAGQQDMIRLRNRRTGIWQSGVRVGTDRGGNWQDRHRWPRPDLAAGWSGAVRNDVPHTAHAGVALPLPLGRQTYWQVTRKPPAGRNNGVVPPGPGEVCYTPPNGLDVPLLFRDPLTGDTHLVFVCGNRSPDPEPSAPIIVPIKRVYIVLNESSLRRVDGNIPLPTFGMSLSLDVDSWTWRFSATLPGATLPDLEPASAGEPVLVEALINGVAYRMQVEGRGRDRSFGQSAIRISGRGVSATLDSPYAPILNHGNPNNARTAQQLMNDVLTLNGVSIGWAVDWQAVDWSVPAGLFSHQGSYIAALNAIAAAAGSYIQPHRTDQVLRVLPRYPTAPWEWEGVTPDIEIPADVATVESIEWIEKAAYNRVFVSGIRSGVLGQVTRAGTDGSNVAPMVTDALITTAAAARQRGLPVLADTGSQAHISLRMPVLAETGIIVPGKILKYTDGATVRRGITRSVQVDDGTPEIWQTIGVETHA